MAKISVAAKKKYFDKIKEYKKIVNSILEREKKILALIKQDEKTANYKRLTLSDENLNIASYLLLMNNLSLSLLGVRSEEYLNDARKSIYKSIIYLEEIVTSSVDSSFSEYEERLATIESFDDVSRYHLVQKLGFTVFSVEEAYGKNSKWKWSFVELEGRFTVVVKNLVSFKAILGRLSPHVPGYDERRAHLDLVLEMLKLSSTRYREKYELSTLRIDDMKTGIQLLQALKRVQILLGEKEEIEVTKRKIDVWSQKMEADLKKKEAESPRLS
ncbi:MAG: hypothetical protein EHM28_00015 [Spirochaetaceae bacterium]|nr:MAG: hypothetical protein EHM28_00015 [Spirochaetaceae bacterium]